MQSTRAQTDDARASAPGLSSPALRRLAMNRLANQGGLFMDWLAMQGCTSRRNAFFTGMDPLRTGMIPPQLPGSPFHLRPRRRRSSVPA
jgi:arylsulfatase A-like enzyme